MFASANIKEMGAVLGAGSVISRTEQVFAKNRLVVVYPKDNPAGLQELKDLARADLKLVLAAKEVPLGQYALDFLGEADAGILYLSDISGADADKVAWIEIPDALNVIAIYPVAPVKESKHAELAQVFIDLVLSQEGQQVLAKYNFIR